MCVYSENMLLKCLKEQHYDILNAVCGFLRSAKYLGRLNCVCRDLHKYLETEGENHWLELVKNVGKRVEWRQDVSRVLCPWLMRRGPMDITVRMGDAEWRMARIQQWIFQQNVVTQKEEIFVRGPMVSGNNKRVGGGVVMSKGAPYKEVVGVVATIQEFDETHIEWSQGFEALYDMLVSEGFIPEWLKTDDDEKPDNVRFIPFHTSSVAVVVIGMENSVIHIFHVHEAKKKDTKQFCYVRTIHMPDYMYLTQILCDPTSGLWWIPLRMGTFEVWGCPQNRQDLRTPASQLYPLFCVLENSASFCHKERIFCKYEEILKRYVNVKVPYNDADNAETLLHTAVRNEDEQYAEMLLRMGADPNVRNEGEGLSPLTLALTMPNMSHVAQMMLHYGGDPKTVCICE